MAYRILFIANPAKLSASNEQLIIESEMRYSVPFEDILGIMMESQQITVSVYALSKMAEDGIGLFVCNAKHIPCGILLPYCNHSRQLNIIRNQLAMTKPMQKQLWKQVVTAKIRNQAKCLELNGNINQARLFRMAEKVHSGDPENLEGTAAAIYFRSLFGFGFSRGKDCVVNAALNYGYAILRGMVARALSVYGFMPALGIHHCSELNAFNLADDFIEPFRPVVDLYVSMSIKEEDNFGREEKTGLFNLLNCDICSGEGHYTVAYAIEKMVKSYSACCLKDADNLILPELLPLKLHQYE